MAKRRLWVLLESEDEAWHTSAKRAPGLTRCGLSSAQVRRVTNATPAASACVACADGLDMRPAGEQPARLAASANSKPKPSKAVLKKAAELRAQGVRDDLAEALAVDALSRSGSRSVRAVQGGLPTLGRRGR